jgi:hypothetical protein
VASRVYQSFLVPFLDLGESHVGNRAAELIIAEPFAQDFGLGDRIMIAASGLFVADLIEAGAGLVNCHVALLLL